MDKLPNCYTVTNVVGVGGFGTNCLVVDKEDDKKL